MDIKFPDLLGLGSKEIIVLEQLPDLEQKFACIRSISLPVHFASFFRSWL